MRQETRNRGFNPGSTVNRGFSLATHAVELAPGIVADRQRLPSVIVYVRQSAKWLRAFYRFCQQHNVGVTVWGAPDPETGKRPKVVKVGGPTTESVRQADGTFRTPCADETVCGQVDAWECVFESAETMEALTTHPMLYNWHPIVANRVPVQASGTGTEKQKASKPKEKHKRDATTRAVVTGHELNEEGERVATWELQAEKKNP